jgi:hypothetical protein
MKALILFALLMTSPIVLFDFSENSDRNAWRIEDDRVMGGISQGKFKINDEGHGHFHGYVTTENNGGVSSIQYALDEPIKIGDAKTIKIRVKGDGKRYQFRIKADRDTYYSHQQYFKTSGEWETVELRLKDFSAGWRGRKVDVPNFEDDQIEFMRFLIGNKKKQEFSLLIDKIWVE